MATGANEQGEGKKSLSPQFIRRRRSIVAVQSGEVTAHDLLPYTWREINEPTAHYARKSRRRLGDCAACGHFITDRPVSVLGPPRTRLLACMAEDDSAMTSSKDALFKSNNPKENNNSKNNQALEGIFSLYPADIPSTTGSGATPIGSAACAPDRNKKLRI